MKISQDEDAQIVMFSQENHMRFNNQSNGSKIQNKSSRKFHVYYIIAIFAILIAFYFLKSSEASRQKGQPNANYQIQEKQIVELTHQIAKLQKSESSNRDRINELKKRIDVLNNANNHGIKENLRNNVVSTKQNVKQISKHTSKMKKVAVGTVSEISYLIKNEQGYGIEEVLYGKGDIDLRREFYQKRFQFLENKKQQESLILANFNNKLDEETVFYQREVQEEEYLKLDEKWSFQDYPEELPMCVVVPGYNNNKKFRIEYNLNSIFQQNYTNYFVVIIDDASTDGSSVIYEKYLSFYNIGGSKHIFIKNSDRKTAVENIYTAVKQYCDPQSIVVNVDGDDELIGKNVLKVFNAAYQKLKAGVVYSNFYFYEQGISVMQGFTSEYEPFEKKENLYRGISLKFSHLMSFRAELLLKINERDLKDENGNFYRSAYNLVLYFPLMESACERVFKIEGVHYLYNTNTGLNDDLMNRDAQIAIDVRVRASVRYSCNLQFKRKMEN